MKPDEIKNCGHDVYHLDNCEWCRLCGAIRSAHTVITQGIGPFPSVVTSYGYWVKPVSVLEC